HMRPSELHILDFSRAYSAKCAPSQLRSVLISHDAVGYDPSRHPAVMRVSEQNVLGRILLQTFVSVFDELDRTSKNDAPTIASSLIALVSGVIAAAPDREPDFPGFTMARNKAIRAHIERNLASHTLDLETLCSQFHMSRATLYRDFREEGGLERYILGRKLDAALMALAFGPADRGAVTRAASQWHFASVSHFSREFRRRFGFAASDVVGQHNRARSSLSVAGNAEEAARPPDLGTFLSQL
ncbi:MAG: AraC family transcriptional regulator, partial [Pseudomonadota bacterium]